MGCSRYGYTSALQRRRFAQPAPVPVPLLGRRRPHSRHAHKWHDISSKLALERKLLPKNRDKRNIRPVSAHIRRSQHCRLLRIPAPQNCNKLEHAAQPPCHVPVPVTAIHGFDTPTKQRPGETQTFHIPTRDTDAAIAPCDEKAIHFACTTQQHPAQNCNTAAHSA